MIAFWEYDAFPFVLWGEVQEIGPDEFQGAYVKIKGYTGMAFRKEIIIAIVSEEQAKPIIERIEYYSATYESIRRGLHEKVDLTLNQLPKPHWNILLEPDLEIEGAL